MPYTTRPFIAKAVFEQIPTAIVELIKSQFRDGYRGVDGVTFSTSYKQTYLEGESYFHYKEPCLDNLMAALRNAINKVSRYSFITEHPVELWVDAYSTNFGVKIKIVFDNNCKIITSDTVEVNWYRGKIVIPKKKRKILSKTNHKEMGI